MGLLDAVENPALDDAHAQEEEREPEHPADEERVPPVGHHLGHEVRAHRAHDADGGDHRGREPAALLVDELADERDAGA
ncbi:MAG: hypothetical protein ACK55I_11900, partial [bacterium]